MYFGKHKATHLYCQYARTANTKINNYAKLIACNLIVNNLRGWKDFNYFIFMLINHTIRKMK